MDGGSEGRRGHGWLFGVLAGAVVLGSAAAPAAQVPAQAYCRTGMTLWQEPATAKTLVIAPSFPRRMRQPLKRALRQWNRSGSVLRYRKPLPHPDWARARWHGLLATSPLLQGTPGMARRFLSGDRHTGGQLFLNADYRWVRARHNIARGTADVQTVAVHEVGHFTGLAHPWSPHCRDGSRTTAAERRSVMTAVGVGKRRRLGADDVAAVRALY